MAYTGETQKNNYTAVREYPTILAALKDENGVLEPSIDPNNSPLFIKIPRRRDTDAKDSQRRVTVYRRMTYGMRRSADGSWVHYPIYIKVEPKGNLLRGNFLMTEYGREDSTHKEFGPSEDGLRKMFVLGDFIARNQIESYKQNYSNLFGQLIEDMNYQNLFETKFSRREKEFTDALNKKDSVVIEKTLENNVVDDKQNKSPKQIEYERFFSNPQNSRFEKLAKVVFNRIDEFGIEIEYDQDLEVQGKFIRGYNKILVRPDHNSENTLLHECIHALTSYYCDAYEDDRESLPKEI